MTNNSRFLRFEYIFYPLWRRSLPAVVRPFSDLILSRFFPVGADRHPPDSPKKMAKHLAKWQLFGDDSADKRMIEQGLESSQPPITHAGQSSTNPTEVKGLIRIPAQWEPVKTVLISWGVMYPPIWEMHAQMAEAVSQVADVEILVTTEMWARAILFYLSWRGKANMNRVRFLLLPIDDIWIRDYGPVMGYDEAGNRIAINALYDPLPQYPQADDNAMPERWAAHNAFPIQALNLHTEGGNLWSDGQGTLLMSEQIFYSNRYHDRDSLLTYLHTILDFQKMIITPRLRLEETGHIDLLVKLASADTVLVCAPTSFTTGMLLRNNKRLLERETNAAGQPYNVVELPTPPLYLNWIFYTIRRAYTNSLTVNGRVLVPTYAIPDDDIALKVYEETMPDYEIIPIDCRKAINGGGAVHCMTKEIPV